MNEDEMIKELYEDIIAIGETAEDVEEIATYLCNLNYCKVGKDEIVIKKSEYETLKAQNDTLELAVKDLRYRNAQFSEANKLFAKRNDELLDELQGATAIKEKTAREILQELYMYFTADYLCGLRNCNKDHKSASLVKILAKAYGIDLED